MAITPIPKMKSPTSAPSIMPGATPVGGKGSKQQDMGSPHAGQMSTLAGGEPLSRMMGHYGKGHSFAPPGIRGGAGGIKANVRKGGLGPGQMSAPGTSANYSMTSADTE